MKKIFAFIGVLFLSLSLISCSDKNQDPSDTNDGINDVLNDLKEQQVAINEKLDSLINILDNLDNDSVDLTEIESLLESVVDLVGGSSNEENPLESILLDIKDLLIDIKGSDSSQSIEELMLNLKYLKESLVYDQIDDYLLSDDISDDYKRLFSEKASEMVEEGLGFKDIVNRFNEDYMISNILLSNEPNSLDSSIEITVPSKVEYDSIDFTMSYHNKILMKKTYEEKEDIVFDYSMPNYGSYDVETTIYYGNNKISQTHKLNVTTSHYNFALLNGTKPVLMFAADHIANPQEAPTYIVLQRGSTFNWEHLPENTFEFPDFIKNAGNWRYEGLDQLSKWILELHNANPASTFTLNVVDNYIGVAITAFDRFEIPENVYTVNIWTDGTFTDSVLNKYTSEKYFNNSVTKINEHRLNTKNIAAEDIDYSQVNSITRDHALAYATVVKNVNYYVSGTNGIKVDNQYVLDVMSSHLTVKSIPDLFEDLKNSGNINTFEYLLGTRWGEEPDEGLSHVFNSDKGKYILILGTSVAGENTSASKKYYTFEDYVLMLKDLYGDEYEILYKGHPAHPSSEERKDFFEEHNVTELRHTIPVEIMMYIYPNVYIGGYRGSSFLTSQKDQTLFFFGPEAYIKGQATLKDLIENTDIFDNTVYLYDENQW